MVTGFVTGCVLQAKHFPTGLPRRSGRAHAQPGTPAELLAQRRQMAEFLSICCVPSKSEGLAAGTAEDDATLRLVLRLPSMADHGDLLSEYVVHAHGRITASPSCGYRTVRQIKLISA